jgi:hypothetical protein
MYIDLKLHTHREKLLWIQHVVRKNNILVQAGLTKTLQEAALEYLALNRDKLRDLSIRTALEIATYMKMKPAEWQKFANNILLR